MKLWKDEAPIDVDVAAAAVVEATEVGAATATAFKDDMGARIGALEAMVEMLTKENPPTEKVKMDLK